MPIATITATELIELANSVGFSLALTADNPGARLYLWTTPEDEVLYIGKADRARPLLRTKEEEGWARRHPHGEEFLSGFIHLAHRNHARRHLVQIQPRNGRSDGFDPRPALTGIEDWSGPAATNLQARLLGPQEWSVADVETVLIRIAVRCGVPIGNSAGASQWESPIGDPRDSLAALAADLEQVCCRDCEK